MSIRLDRYLAESGFYTRREASKLIRAGGVSVNGIPLRDPAEKISEDAAVTAEGREIGFRRTRWIMLSKPSGYVSTTEDDPKSVMKLLPEQLRRVGLFPCGRLDIDTTGLLILTSDGAAAHNLLSPRRHCEKVYRFTSAPCRVEMKDPEHGEIVLTEGKYHQIKRMFQAVGSEILTLERIRFGGVPLDPSLAPGEWRELTEEEISLLTEPRTKKG